MKLDATSQVNPTGSILNETLIAYALEPVVWRVCPEGVGNVVVRAETADGGAYFVKYYNARHPRSRVEDEVGFTDYLSRMGLSVPSYIERTDGTLIGTLKHPDGENVITVTRQVDGAHPLTYSGFLLVQLAYQHARMHQESRGWPLGEELDPFTSYHYSSARPEEVELVALEASMLPIIERIQSIWGLLPKGMTHLDITRSNILTKDEQLTGTIDFGDTSIAPYVFCLAGTLWDIFISEGSMQDVRTYLSEYQKYRPLTYEEHVALPDMLALRGWIALHGSLLTVGPQAERSREQMHFLKSTISKGLFVS